MQQALSQPLQGVLAAIEALHARVAEVLQQGGTVGACGTGISGLSEAIDLVKNENILYITGAKATKELKAMDTSKRPLIVGKLGEFLCDVVVQPFHRSDELDGQTLLASAGEGT